MEKLILDYDIVIDDKNSAENCIVLRSTISTEAEVSDFLKHFSVETDTQWIIWRKLPSASRVVLHQKWVCYHHKRNKVAVSQRNLHCEAYIDVTIKKENRFTAKNDIFLKLTPSRPTIIKLNVQHSHPVRSADTFRMLRVRDEVKQQFRDYFANGMGPSEASHFHEAMLLSEDLPYEVLANAAINPTDRQIGYLHSLWRQENFGPAFDPFDKLREKIPSYEENGAVVQVEEALPWAILVVSPVMRRAQTLPCSSEIIFIDTTSSCEATSSSLTVVLTATKAGAIPVAVLLHQFQTTENYKVAFGLLKKHFPVCFGGKEAPIVFMTDDSKAEKEALRAVWPTSNQLLCHFHVAQAQWRWLWSNNVLKEDKPRLMKLFQKVMYAKTEYELHKAVLDMLDVEEKYPNFVHRFWIFFERRAEWVAFFRSDLLIRDNNTNNYAEATMRILKDVVLLRTKAFNVVSLTEFCVSVWNQFLVAKLLHYAYNRKRSDHIDQKLSKKVNALSVKDVENTDDHTYIIHLNSEKETNKNYTINTNLGICSCYSGQNGAFCKHQFFLFDQGIVSIPNCPTITQAERHTFARLALGEGCPEFSFFANNQQSLEPDYEISRMEVDCQGTEETMSNQERSQNETAMATEEDKLSLAHEIERWKNLCGEDIPQRVIQTLVKAMKKARTKGEVVSSLRTASLAISSRCQGRVGKKIKIQPTSIARRRPGLTRGCSQVARGRPPKALKEKTKVKRRRNLALNIRLNQRNSKSHGSGH